MSFDPAASQNANANVNQAANDNFTAPTSTNPNTAVNQASAQKTTTGLGNLDSSSTVSSLNDLKAKSPELFKKMMEGIGQNICRRMKDGQDRLKEIQREGRDG